MATKLGEAFVEITGRFKGLEDGVRRETQQAGKQLDKGLVAAGGEAGDKAGKRTGSRFRGAITTSLRGIGTVFAGALAGIGVVGFFRDAISGASDLGETLSKARQIFGSSAGDVERFASNANEALGQTRTQAIDAASTFGVFGKAAGLSGRELTGFSTELVTLSADMASFANATPEEAITAIGAALRGEAEPIRRFGVLLDDATLRQEALKQGLIETTKDALTPQQKTLASYAVIMEQTKDVQGDFARTSDGLANQQRKLAARWSDLKTNLGTGLLPVVTDFVGFLSNDAIPAVITFGSAIGDAFGIVRDVISAIPTPIGVAAAAMAGLIAFGPRIAAFATTVGTAVAGPFLRFGQQMQVQTALAENWGRQLSTAGAAATVFRTRVGGLGGVVSSVGRGFRGLINLLGGPWTIALSAAVAGITHLITRQSDAEKAAEGHKQSIEGLSDALVSSRGQFDKSALQQVTRALEDASILNNAQNLGIELNSLRDAVAKGGPAAKQFERDLLATADTIGGEMSPAVRALTAQFLQNGGAAGDYAETISLLADRFQDTTDASDEQRNAFVGQFTEILDLAGGYQSLSKETEGQVAAARRQIAANKEQKSSTDEVKKSTQELAQELTKLIAKEKERAGVVLSARESQRAFQAAIDDASDSVKEHGRTLDIDTAEGRENQAALDKVADAAHGQAAALRANDAPAATIRKRMRDARSEFIRTALGMGLTKDQANDLADELRLIPGNYKANVNAQTKGRGGVRALKREIDRLPPITTVAVLARVTAAIAGVGSILGAASGGLVRGPGTGTSDTAGLYALSNREFVVRRAAVDRFGVGLFEALNSLQVPRLATGGVPRLQTGGMVGGPSPVATSGSPLQVRVFIGNEELTGFVTAVSDVRIRERERAIRRATPLRGRV